MILKIKIGNNIIINQDRVFYQRYIIIVQHQFDLNLTNTFGFVQDVGFQQLFKQRE
jgi:hypothetical protein